MWQVVKGILSVGVNLVNLNIPVDKKGKRCGCIDETVLYALIQCSVAWEV